MSATEALIPLTAVFCIFGLPVLAWVFFRLMAHRERMEMLRQGLVPAHFEGKQRWAPTGPPPGNWAPGAPVPGRDEWTAQSAHASLRKGITLTMIGFALTIGLSCIGFVDDSPGGWHPGPWLLGGLVPLFVGLSQVIIAMMSGATIGPARPWTAEAGAPPPPPGAAAPPPTPPTYDGSYTYRPGATQELRPPSQPPERR